MDRNLQLIGMARKAGLLAVGCDAVKAAARAGKARLVFSASDASEGSVKRACYSSRSSGAVHIHVPYTKFEIGTITGRGSPGTAAILDVGLAAGFVKGLAAREPERYSEVAEVFEKKAHHQAEKRQQKRRTGV